MASTTTASVAQGISAEGVKRDKHPVWYPPSAVDGTGLRVANSLTETVEPFAPRQGRVVRWYTCGPTVYDVAHMGHARAYLTFDILRRVMEDYFGYEVQYQMNITDIDDKIIKRARINKLLKDYRQELGSNLDALKASVEKAKEAGAKRLESTKAKLTAPLPETATTRVKNEREEKLQELELKTKQFDETVALISKCTTFEELWTAAESLIGDSLDAERGGSVTDQAIFEAHARYYERTFFDDMARLGVREPDMISRVTEYVPQVVTFVEKIIANGFAYVAESSVFFDTDAFTKAGHDYAKLKGGADKATTEAEMAEGEGTLSKTVDGEKRSPNDFALWKFSKPGEPAWPSPWGEGRPGWHIECSVMASDIFGDNMDIHAGGWDLKFPHHDNECAQSEAFHCNHQWVNYFFHCGHLHIDGLKMSKSLKNFITIRQALDERNVTPRAMRLLFLETPWNAMMSFSDQSIIAAEERDRVLRAFFGSLDVAFRQDYLATTQGATDEDRVLFQKITDAQGEVHRALCNNFDFPTAFGAIMNLVSYINQYLLLTNQRPSVTLLKKAGRFITRILRTLGVIQGGDDIGYGAVQQGGAETARFNHVTDTLVRFRDDVRANARTTKEMSFMGICDKVRDEWLIPAGVRIEDKPGGLPSTWKNDEPELLQREADDRKAAVEQERVRKINNQMDVKKQLVTKWEQFHVDPTQLFVSAKDKYSAFDAAGVPTKDVAGADIPEKAQKKLQKDLEKYTSGYGEFQKKGGKAWLDGVRTEIDDLKKQL